MKIIRCKVQKYFTAANYEIVLESNQWDDTYSKGRRSPWSAMSAELVFGLFSAYCCVWEMWRALSQCCKHGISVTGILESRMQCAASILIFRFVCQESICIIGSHVMVPLMCLYQVSSGWAYYNHTHVCACLLVTDLLDNC